MTMEEWGVVVNTVGIFLTTVLSAGMIWVRVAAVSVEQQHSIARVVELAQMRSSADADADEADERRIEFQMATARIFKAFDLDGSGEIDARELRAIMTQMVCSGPNFEHHVCLLSVAADHSPLFLLVPVPLMLALGSIRTRMGSSFVT
jgi:hypothetical protein